MKMVGFINKDKKNDTLSLKKKLDRKEKNLCLECSLYGKNDNSINELFDTLKLQLVEVFIVRGTPNDLDSQSETLLKTVLEKCGFVNTFITSVVKCPISGIPSDEIIKCCKSKLISELELSHKKKLIIVYGELSAKWFGIPDTAKNRGFFHETKWGKVLVVNHPMLVIKNIGSTDIFGNDKLDYFAKDFKNASYFISTGKTSKDISNKLRVVSKKEDLIAMENDFKNWGGKVGVDFETTSLDIYGDCRLLSAALSCGSEFVWAIPFKFLDSSILDEAKNTVKNIMNCKELITHQASFDALVGKVFLGTDIKEEINDTLIMCYLLDGGNVNTPGRDLKRLVLDLLDYGDYGIEAENLDSVDMDSLVIYNATDALVLNELFDILWNKMPPDLQDCYVNVVRKISQLLIEASNTGMCVDLGYILNLRNTLSDKIDNIKSQALSLVVSGINLDSPKQILGCLQSRGHNITSTAQNVLEYLKNKGNDNFVSYLLEYRQLVKLQRTYVEPYLTEYSKGNIVHPQFNVSGTATGRISCSNPNLQNIPTRHGSDIEKMFISRWGNDGYIIKADYSQMELRIGCCYSDDRVMLDIFKRGEDIHSRVAIENYGITEEEIKRGTVKAKEVRRMAKGFNFGVIYGRGPYSIAMELGISEDEAIKKINKYFEYFYGLKKWIDETHKEALRNGYVKSMFGRIRYIPELKSFDTAKRGEGLRKAINTPIQSAASDVALLGGYLCRNEIKERVLKSYFCNFVHDALFFDCHKDCLDEVVGIIKEKAIAVELPIGKEVPLAIDIAWGKNWGDCK